MSEFYLNSVDRRDSMSIHSGQTIKKSNDWIFLNKQKTFLSLVFNQPVAMATAHNPCQNAGINTSVDNLDSCKKRAPKHKWFKSNGELGIGT